MSIYNGRWKRDAYNRLTRVSVSDLERDITDVKEDKKNQTRDKGKGHYLRESNQKRVRDYERRMRHFIFGVKVFLIIAFVVMIGMGIKISLL